MKQLEVDALAKVLTPQMIADVLSEAGRESERERKLPATLVVWLVVGMGLYRHLAVENVLERIATALNWRPWRGSSPCATSITAARDRLGWETVRLLFRRLAAHLCAKYRSANLWHGLEVFTLDGTCFMAADTRETEGWFGRPRCSGGRQSAFPQLRAVMIVGVWTHVVAHAVFGPYTTSEIELASHALGLLAPGSLLLLDRAYYGFRWAALFVLHGTNFAVRMKQGKNTYKVTKVKQLGPSDYLCTALRPKNLRRDPGRAIREIQVRVICGTREGFRPIYVMTNLLDPIKYPAHEILALYGNRWEAELAYREIKTYLVGKRVTFRSKKPDRVLQEAYGLLLAYNCVRAVMCDAALQEGVRPTHLSFTDSLDRTRHALDRSATGESLVLEVRSCHLPPRRVGRRYVRAVKIKLTSNFPRKRPGTQLAASPYVNRARQRQRAVAPAPML
jgi:hypothetical protein